MGEQERLYAMALARICRFNFAAAQAIYRAMGSATAAYDNRVDIARLAGGCPTRILKELGNWDTALLRAEAEMEFAARHSVRVLTPADPDYPRRLDECPDAPLALYYRGTANLNSARVISVVGTRHCTAYGRDMVQELMAGLRGMFDDVLVVSGLAYGVDICAHRQALAEGFDTVAVMAHGLDRIYPPSHRDTAKAMLEQGGLLTEFMSGTNADKANFVMRNRIVAGMADATVLVESAARGGGLITAGIARSYNREVLAYPGAVGAPYSEGCNRLIRDNAAVLVTSAADVAETLGWATQAHAEAARRAGIARQLFPELTDEEQAVARLLQQSNDMQLNTMAAQTRMPVARLAALLFQMEMKGLVRPLAGGAYHWID